MEEAGAGFRKELVNKLLQLYFKDTRTRVSPDALQLMAEMLRTFVLEAAVRGVRQAQAEDVPRVDVDQLEKVLPQLVRGHGLPVTEPLMEVPPGAATAIVGDGLQGSGYPSLGKDQNVLGHTTCPAYRILGLRVWQSAELGKLMETADRTG
ncbi:centromere protein X [Rhynchocyon petersi]